MGGNYIQDRYASKDINLPIDIEQVPINFQSWMKQVSQTL